MNWLCVRKTKPKDKERTRWLSKRFENSSLAIPTCPCPCPFCEKMCIILRFSGRVDKIGDFLKIKGVYFMFLAVVDNLGNIIVLKLNYFPNV